tara:strand:+ start:280 stop:510 length:231 start_codon:yes stop_codon:yes gene_type:complete
VFEREMMRMEEKQSGSQLEWYRIKLLIFFHGLRTRICEQIRRTQSADYKALDFSTVIKIEKIANAVWKLNRGLFVR